MIALIYTPLSVSNISGNTMNMDSRIQHGMYGCQIMHLQVSDFNYILENYAYASPAI